MELAFPWPPKDAFALSAAGWVPQGCKVCLLCVLAQCLAQPGCKLGADSSLCSSHHQAVSIVGKKVPRLLKA